MTDDKATKENNKSADGESKTKKEIKDVSKNVEKLVDEIAKLSVMELSDLVNALQDKLGVTAAVPVAAAAVPVAAEGAPEAEQAGGGKQTVVMTGAGENKISVIKALREINQNWGLKEAKDMTEATPVEILKDAKAEEAKSAAEKLKAAGATVELK
jgi:large subunit ribosomal protein L7/L12